EPAQAMVGRGFVPVRSRGRQMLIAVEVAFSALLLVVAGLLVQSLRELQNSPPGYSSDGVVAMQMRMGDRALERRPRFLEEVAAIPGVESVALADSPLPLGTNTDFAVEGQP